MIIGKQIIDAINSPTLPACAIFNASAGFNGDKGDPGDPGIPGEPGEPVADGTNGLDAVQGRTLRFGFGMAD